MSSDFKTPQAGMMPMGEKFKEVFGESADQAQEVAEEQAKIEKTKPFDRKADYTDDDLIMFWNSMLREDQYEKEYSVRTVSFKLRTRSSTEVDRINRYMDVAAPRFQSHYDMVYNKAALAFALVELNGRRVDPKASFEDRLAFLEDKPAPLVNMLIDYLVEFDGMIHEMIAETSSENF